MSLKTVLRLLALSGLLGALPLLAADPPHWDSANTSTDCTSQCHAVHAASGGNLTQSASNVNLCQSCHNASGIAASMPMNSSDVAVPGVTGTSHAFDVSTTNSSYGATVPTGSALYQNSHPYGDKVVCSTCHDPHTASPTAGAPARISAAQKITALASTGTVTSGGTYTGASGAWYLLEIQAAGALGAATFRYSKDSGTTWMQNNLPTAAAVTLDNGIAAGFGAGSYNTGEQWQFYASYPFLRVALDSGTNASGDKFCRDCHSSWVMDHNGTNTYAAGVYRSHPVGEALNANGQGYDRSAPLDANGAAQTGGSALSTLQLDAQGRIQCLTCHAMHFAPSNSSAVSP